jgi:hypothetical protein
MTNTTTNVTAFDKKTLQAVRVDIEAALAEISESMASL